MAVMPVLAKFLRRHRVLAADTMVFIYHLQEHPRYVPATQVILDAWEAGSHQGVTSIISLAEVLVKPSETETTWRRRTIGGSSRRFPISDCATSTKASRKPQPDYGRFMVNPCRI